MVSIAKSASRVHVCEGLRVKSNVLYLLQHAEVWYACVLAYMCACMPACVCACARARARVHACVYVRECTCVRGARARKHAHADVRV